MQGYYSYKTGVLKVTGKDKLDYLNRISTNKFTLFPDMTYIKTVVPNDKGRIIDFCTVLNCSDIFYMICTPGNEDILKSHIEKYIVTEDINVIKEFGVITHFTGNKYLFKDFNNDGNKISCSDDCYMLGDNYGFAKTAVIEIGKSDSMFFKKHIENADKISDKDFAIYCMKYFYLYGSNELNDNNNPLECYLGDYISFNKGCYIGQEVISRINSQGKIPKYLINIESNHKFTKGDLIYTEIDFQETECGYVTSTVEKEKKYFGYGFIRSNVLHNKNKIRINGNEIFINYKNI